MNYRKREPEAGLWFINRTGKLMKVKLIMYRHELIEKVMIEYLEGENKVVNIDDWYHLELNRHISLRNQMNAN